MPNLREALALAEEPPSEAAVMIAAPVFGRGTLSMKPSEINRFLQRDLIGQEETLRYVSVAIFKHLQGEKFGNLLLIGNSGTGKTTIMRAVERLYDETEAFSRLRVVIILNAHTLATEEGVVDTHRLFARLEERARQILGPERHAGADRARRWSAPRCASTRSTRSRRWWAASPTSPASTSSRPC